jgi:hypothetical protein
MSENPLSAQPENPLSAYDEQQLTGLSRHEKQRLVRSIDACLSALLTVRKITTLEPGAAPIKEPEREWARAIEPFRSLWEQLKGLGLLKFPRILLGVTEAGPDGSSVGLHRYPEQWRTFATERNEYVSAALSSLKGVIAEQLPSDEEEQYVTLDQAAAWVNRSKKTLERAVNKEGSDAPPPDVEGGGGRAHEWRWSTLRPWLERTYNKILPERPPSRARRG